MFTTLSNCQPLVWCFLLFLPVLCCQSPASPTEAPITPIQSQDSIISEHLKNGAYQYHYYSQEWQREIDKGLAKDSTIAYLWQQKAMPLFKQGKYELGMTYVDKAVEYNPRRWQDYRAFIKCIFAKTYAEAIADFEDCKAKFGYGYVQDHSYDFYIALSKIQLNQFAEAATILAHDIQQFREKVGAEVLHHLDLFYLGICYYELGENELALQQFDEAIELYSQFADAQYYKALTLKRLDQLEAAQALYDLALANGKAGYSINEDNAIYERYPYQVRWALY